MSSLFVLPVVAGATALGAMATFAEADTVTFGAAPVVRDNPNTGTTPERDFLSSNGGLEGESGFVVVTDTDGGGGESLALRARSRDNNNAIVKTGPTSYVVNSGFDSTGRPNFYLEYQFTPGSGLGLSNYTDYSLGFAMTGPNGFAYSESAAIESYWSNTDGYLVNKEYGNKGGIDDWYNTVTNTVDTSTEFVVANSWQLPYFPGMDDYDPFATGLYTIEFFLNDAEGFTVVSNQIGVTVVPSPSVALGGVGMLAVTALKRRRKLA